ncbi:MAG: hypothetical protein P8Z37_13615 [Acidobacteriota bacterium]|jgi:hypothetical protein
MSFKLSGMSDVLRNMEQLKQALHGAVAKASFDPQDPQDVERSIRKIEQEVDLRLAPYFLSPGVQELTAELKQECRKALLQKAEVSKKNSP